MPEATAIADMLLRWNLKLIYRNRAREISAPFGKKDGSKPGG